MAVETLKEIPDIFSYAIDACDVRYDELFEKSMHDKLDASDLEELEMLEGLGKSIEEVAYRLAFAHGFYAH